MIVNTNIWGEKMADNFLKIDQLSDTARKTAVKQFMTFYLKLYKSGNLDVISNEDHQNVIVEINRFIIDNTSFLHDELIGRLMINRYQEFYIYLTQLDQTYSEDGTTAAMLWADWLRDKESHIDIKESLS